MGIRYEKFIYWYTYPLEKSKDEYTPSAIWWIIFILTFWIALSIAFCYDSSDWLKQYKIKRHVSKLKFNRDFKIEMNNIE